MVSRFIGKLNRVSQAVPQSMGFRAAQPLTEKPKILLIASLAEASTDNLAERVAGADAGLLHVPELSTGTKTLREVSRAVPDIPWGGWLRGGSKAGMQKAEKAGCDFVVFPATDTPLAILRDDEIGKVLQVEASLSEGLLRVINELPVDAVLITNEQREGSFLTWHHLMLFQRFADLLAKPLLALVPSGVTADELQVLWEAGVDGVVVEVGVKQPVSRLEELRQAANGLAFPSTRKRGKAEALLPPIGGGVSAVTEEEEEEE